MILSLTNERETGHDRDDGAAGGCDKGGNPGISQERRSTILPKRTFQAIRIEVNGELEQLKTCQWMNSVTYLLPGGRLCIITFHSLEDRIVKEAFVSRRLDPCTLSEGVSGMCLREDCLMSKKVTGKPIVSGKDELSDNPRAQKREAEGYRKEEVKNMIAPERWYEYRKKISEIRTVT